MNRIVREHYPVEKLPEDLRALVPGSGTVRVELQPEQGSLPSISTLLAMVPAGSRSKDEIDVELAALRDEWD